MATQVSTKLVSGIRNSLRKEFTALLKGAEGDVERYVDTISTALAGAIVSGNEKMVEEAQAQILHLYEINRIRFVRGAKGFLTDAFKIALKVAAAVVSRFLSGGLLG